MWSLFQQKPTTFQKFNIFFFTLWCRYILAVPRKTRNKRCRNKQWTEWGTKHNEVHRIYLSQWFHHSVRLFHFFKNLSLLNCLHIISVCPFIFLLSWVRIYLLSNFLEFFLLYFHWPFCHLIYKNGLLDLPTCFNFGNWPMIKIVGFIVLSSSQLQFLCLFCCLISFW
jgi:hypothetical protein